MMSSSSIRTTLQAAVRLPSTVLRHTSFRSYSNIAAAASTSETLASSSDFPTDYLSNYKIQIRGRKLLPAAQSSTMVDFIRAWPADELSSIDFADKEPELASSLEDCLANSQHIRQLIDAVFNSPSRPGYVILRNLPLEDGNDFSKFYKSLNFTNFSYKGGSGVRTDVASNVMTASDEPPEMTIEPHNEMTYLETFPQKFIAYCYEPAAPGHGGETTITDVRDIWNKLDKTAVKTFLDNGIVYHRFNPDQKNSNYLSWQECLGTTDRQEAEAFMKSSKQQWKWDDNGDLRWWRVLPALRKHYATGENLWLNQIHSQNASYFREAQPMYNKLTDLPDENFPFTTFSVDMKPVPQETLDHIRQISWSSTKCYAMQKGDVMLMDNYYCQHGRMSFDGKRRLFVALANE